MTPQQLRAKEECEAHHRRTVARRKKQKRDRTIALLALLGIILAIFGGGTAFGWHLGTVHMASTNAVKVQDTAAPPLVTPATFFTVSSTPDAVTIPTSTPKPTPTETVENLLLSADIVSDGNLLSFELQEMMQLLCKEYGIPYALALAVADTESRFDPTAVSNTNDYGLMQINKVNHEWLQDIGIDPLTVEGNVEAGIYILADKYKRYGDIELALMAYNCGDTGARRLWDKGTYSTSYSRKVMACY